MSARTELVVEMTCDSCVQSVQKALSQFDGIENLDISLETRQVVVTGTVPTSAMVRAIRASGLRVAVAGKSSASGHLGSAVAQFVGPEIKGVMFFTQLTDEECLVDVTLDGLEAKAVYELILHQWGDMSDNYSKVGGIFSLPSGEERGRIGKLSTEAGSAQLIDVLNFNVEMLYGRTACLHKDGVIVGAAMVVRSSGVFQNTKRICACDGTSIWEAAQSNI